MLCDSCLKQDGCRYYKEYVSHLKPNDTVGSCEWYFKNPFENMTLEQQFDYLIEKVENSNPEFTYSEWFDMKLKEYKERIKKYEEGRQENRVLIRFQKPRTNDF